MKNQDGRQVGKQDAPEQTSNPIIPIKYKNVIVATTLVLADGLGTDDNNIKVNFSRNKARFVKGKHYFELSHSEVTESNVQNYKGTKGLILWTERGAARHAKLLSTDAAWDLFEDMEDTYFRTKQKESPAIPAYTATQRLKDAELSINLLERLGQLDDRDKINYADTIRNAGQLMLPQAVDVQPISISTRITERGLKASRGDLIRIGGITSKIYESKYGEPPIKRNQYVDGAPRKVCSYTTEHLEIIDQAIDEVLEVNNENA